MPRTPDEVSTIKRSLMVVLHSSVPAMTPGLEQADGMREIAGS